ncbi:Hydroxymethylpyrimidine/phosphomethylpyrimidine kinase [Stieleria maiorica]|uniref:hydroxymethylpyrimidine kinase n=1 Tax=Stieleria maiorica TaxID=2795974 RepID=A0A5B9MKA3_9BACT|nr:bifunctional hydroxymethylpyrimidine kinase/phosphomethylpyrimidine kinase [Stieleria maiorica]QEG00125.1 Hydroxymethylpyrimidine/phosphomethylpyrimidine kinase [Stieleria maiorica]
MKKKRSPKKSSHDASPVSVQIARQAIALTIAGSDPSGGAGLQADLKAFQQNGVYGMSVVTLLTVQNTMGVKRVETMPVDLVEQQLEAVVEDIEPLAIKTGALGTPAIVRAVAERLKSYHGDVIVDPVLISKHGDLLGGDSMVYAYRKYLFPVATLVTPNRYEVEALLGRKLTDLDSICDAAHELLQFGPEYVLIKAGVIDGLRHHVLADQEQTISAAVKDVPGNHGHGAGCSLSATIAAALTRCARTHPQAKRVRAAVEFGIAAVHAAVTLTPPLGKGCRPVEHRVLDKGTSGKLD